MSTRTADAAAAREPDLAGRLSGLMRRYQRDVDAMDQALADSLGVNRTDLRCLDLLFDRQLAIGELGREAGLSPQAATTMVDRLEAAGYLERVPDPSDRRRVVVRATRRIHAKAETALSPFLAEVSGVTASRSAAELEVLVSFISDVCEIRERHAEALRSQPGATTRSKGNGR